MAFTLTPAEADEFVGREMITKELVKQLSSNNRIGFSLSGIRRVGKTSILKEVERSLVRQGVPVVYVSIWRVSPNTIDEFIRVLNRATLKAFEDRLTMKFRFDQLLQVGRGALVIFLQNLKLSAKITEDLELSVSYVRKETDDVDEALTAAFSLVEHFAEMPKSGSSKRTILMLDEFPSMVELTYGTKNQKIGESVIKLVRTLYEEFKNTKLVVSGSYRQTMKNLVAKQRSPFYKQLLLREIEPFTYAEYEEFIERYLPALRFSGVDAKDELYNLTSGIPYNLQLLGAEIQLEELDFLDSKKIHALVERTLRKEGELSFREFVNELSPSEIKVLKRLADSPDSRPNEIARTQFLDMATVGSSLYLLTRKGIVTRSARGSYKFSDNIFREWLRLTEET